MTGTSSRPSLLTTGCTVAAAENIIAWLKPAIEGGNPDQVSVVERHIGAFNTPAEVKSYMSDRDGSVRLAALRVRNIQHRAGGTIGVVTWAAYVMTSDQWGYSRDTRAEVVVGKLARRIAAPEATRGMKAERAATAINADNIYSAGLNDLGVTMWAVTWEQENRLDEQIDLADLPDFLRLGATFVTGATSVSDVINVREEE